MNKNISVFAIYPDRGAAEEAVETLRQSGFRNADVSLLLPENAGSKEFAHEKHSKAPEGATAGGASGALIGGTLGWLTGAVVVSGFAAPLLAAGPIVGLLAGMGAGGAVGGLIGALVGLGLPEYEAKRYEGRLRTGGVQTRGFRQLVVINEEKDLRLSLTFSMS